MRPRQAGKPALQSIARNLGFELDGSLPTATMVDLLCSRAATVTSALRKLQDPIAQRQAFRVELARELARLEATANAEDLGIYDEHDAADLRRRSVLASLQGIALAAEDHRKDVAE